MNEHRDTETSVNALTGKIIGEAIEVHRVLGPGLVEPIYVAGFCIEPGERGIRHERQYRVRRNTKAIRWGAITSTCW